MAERPIIRGSVSPRGKRWLAQLPPSLDRRSRIVDSEEAGWQWITTETLKSQLAVGDSATAPRFTVSDLMAIWLEQKLTLKNATRENWTWLIDKCVRRHGLGAMPIADVLPMHVDGCLSSAPPNWTRLNAARVLSLFFDWAENNRFTVGNPYRLSQAKRICQVTRSGLERRASTENVWTPAQLVAFIEHEPCEVFRDLWMFIAATGARRGEACGLRWSNVDIAGGSCWLQDNVTRAGSKVFVEARPKNGKRRKAYFGTTIGGMLAARKAEQGAYRAQCGTWQGDWVFDRRRGRGPSFTPGVYLLPKVVTDRFNRIAAQLSLPPLSGPHGLRRTFATIASHEGFSPSNRIDALGHTPNVSEGYVKSSEAEMRELAERLAKLVLPQ